ncbi:hypothetical protein D3C75_1337700 [compost metagenome]
MDAAVIAQVHLFGKQALNHVDLFCDRSPCAVLVMKREQERMAKILLLQCLLSQGEIIHAVLK